MNILIFGRALSALSILSLDGHWVLWASYLWAGTECRSAWNFQACCQWTILRNIHEMRSSRQPRPKAKFGNRSKLQSTKKGWAIKKADQNTSIMCVPILLYTTSFFRIPSVTTNDKIPIQRLSLPVKRKRGRLTKIRRDVERLFKIKNRFNCGEVSLAFELVPRRNCQCATQPRFRCRDPPRPIWLKVVLGSA